MTNWGAAIRAGFLLAAKICDPDYSAKWDAIPELAELNAALRELEATPAYQRLVSLAGEKIMRMLKRVACMKILMKEVGEAVRDRDLDRVKEVLRKLYGYLKTLGIELSKKEKEKLEELLSAVGIAPAEVIAAALGSLPQPLLIR